MKYLITLLSVLFFVSCSSEAPKDLSKEVDQLIAEDKYEQALTMIENTSPEETEADIDLLKEKVHLNYGIYLEYRGPESSSMRDRMTSALQQYIEVLKINDQNQKAISEIEQIMGIYETMPDNSPGEEIIAELNKLGFDY
ncbi:MAG: hypothetical protein U5J95_10480 [Balneolaceae bacterium]|nr:hypothetical protein [Balneolaceae bacterium]